jgi:hypothetical protein
LKESDDAEYPYFEEFQEWLRPLRLLSKDFNRAIIPIVYSQFDLWKGATISKLVQDFSPAALQVKVRNQTSSEVFRICWEVADYF